MSKCPRLHFYECPGLDCRIEVEGGEHDGLVVMRGQFDPRAQTLYPHLWHTIAGRYNNGTAKDCELGIVE